MEWWLLQRRCARPVRRPPKKRLVRSHKGRYRTESWGCERRALANVEWRRGEVFGGFGFIVDVAVACYWDSGAGFIDRDDGSVNPAMRAAGPTALAAA